jgi:transcriptional regulator with XRE-family HTH domain
MVLSIGMDLGEHIKLDKNLTELLAESGLSSAEVAQAIGVSPASITQYRKGETQPSLNKLVALANELDVSLDYLVLGEGDEAEEIDTGPIVRYMDRSLQDVQTRTSQHSALVAQIGRRISQRIDDEVEAYFSEESDQRLYPGIIANKEIQSLEKNSKRSNLMLQSFIYNLIDEDSGTPGSFFTTVANNLSQGRMYRFLLPEQANDDWSPVIQTFKDLLIEQTKSESIIRTNCRFRITTDPIFASCGLYKLDEEYLEQDDPVLYDYLHEYEYINNNSWFGYVTLPSPKPQGVLVMNDKHLSTALASFDDLWNTAEPI